MSGEDFIQVKNLNGVTVQENGFIRNSKGYIIGKTTSSVLFDSEHLNSNDVVKDAVETLRLSMQDTELGGYAHGWHCNIAMACYDAICNKTYDAPYGLDLELAHTIGNDAASRFMKILFGVKTTNEK